MRLHITNVQKSDYGSYKCVAKNPRGEMDGTIKLYSKFQHKTYIQFLSFIKKKQNIYEKIIQILLHKLIYVRSNHSFFSCCFILETDCSGLYCIP